MFQVYLKCLAWLNYSCSIALHRFINYDFHTIQIDAFPTQINLNC